MAYTRGDPYIWSDGNHLHIWTHSAAESLAEFEGYADQARAGGVMVEESVMDQFAIMRVAELLMEGTLPETVQKTLREHGINFGGAALAKCAAAISGLRAPR